MKNINIKDIFIISLCFIIFTVIGTLTHELGHIFTAEFLGYETKLHYGSMSFKNLNNDGLFDIYHKNEYAIKNNLPFHKKAEYFERIQKYSLESFLITIGGPIQTILTGTIGFLLLYYRRIKNIVFNKFDWLFVFFALFWLRQVFNPTFSIIRRLLRGTGKWIGRSDETKISEFLNLSRGFFDFLLGSIGLLICSYVMFVIIPKNHRLTFIISGIFGGVFGFYFWMYKIGPIVLP